MGTLRRLWRRWRRLRHDTEAHREAEGPEGRLRS